MPEDGEDVEEILARGKRLADPFECVFDEGYDLVPAVRDVYAEHHFYDHSGERAAVWRGAFKSVRQASKIAPWETSPHSQADMLTQVRRRLQQRAQEPVGLEALYLLIGLHSAGMEVLPEGALVPPPPLSVRHHREVRVHLSAEYADNTCQ